MEKKWEFLPDVIEDNYALTLHGLKEQGITYFAHGLERDGVRSCYFSDHRWGKLYIEKKLHEVDPYVLDGQNTKSAFTLWDSIAMDNNGKEVCQARNEICGLVKGITFSIFRHDYHEILAFGTPYHLFNPEEMLTNPTVKQTLIEIMKPARLSHFNYRYGVINENTEENNTL